MKIKLSIVENVKFWYINGQMNRVLSQPTVILANGTKIWSSFQGNPIMSQEEKDEDFIINATFNPDILQSV